MTVRITTNCRKFLKKWEYQTTFICFLRNLYAGQEATVRTRYGTDWFQIGKGVCQGYIYCQPAYLTYIQSITCKMPSWMKHKLESRLQEEHIKNLRYADDTTFMAEREEEQRAS